LRNRKIERILIAKKYSGTNSRYKDLADPLSGREEQENRSGDVKIEADAVVASISIHIRFDLIKSDDSILNVFYHKLFVLLSL
jgi:hypothetical protein